MMKKLTPFGKLAHLIRQRQVEQGGSPCFATEISYDCLNKNCGWHYECFDEAIDLRLDILQLPHQNN
jgi:hypothetical protein